MSVTRDEHACAAWRLERAICVSPEPSVPQIVNTYPFADLRSPNSPNSSCCCSALSEAWVNKRDKRWRMSGYFLANKSVTGSGIWNCNFITPAITTSPRSQITAQRRLSRFPSFCEQPYNNRVLYGARLECWFAKWRKRWQKIRLIWIASDAFRFSSRVQVTRVPSAGFSTVRFCYERVDGVTVIMQLVWVCPGLGSNYTYCMCIFIGR